MRRYEGGVLVGEVDPPPTLTLRQWLESETKLARKGARDAERYRNWNQATSLHSRSYALNEVLLHMDLRGLE